MNIIERFLPDSVTVKCLTGDSGGEEAIQNTTYVLIRMQVILEASKDASCTLRGMQK